MIIDETIHFLRRTMAIAAVGLLGAYLTGPAIAQAPTATLPTTATQPPSVSLADGYVLGSGDVIEVAVLGRDEYRARVQVQVDGTVQLPYINSLLASNRTLLELRNDVRTKLISGGFFTDPVVSVVVATYASRYVVVLGQVGTPGIVPIDRAYHMSELLARVGGTRDSGADVLTLRRANGEELQLPIERVAIGGGEDDPIVNPGDKVYVGPAEIFFITGQINSKGPLKLAPGMTLQMALAQAGGVTDRGSEKRVKISRKGKFLPDITPSTPIKAGDVISVGERFF